MTYHVNSVFHTIQGEGFHSGRAAVFCRFSRCNLWTGREEDRTRAVCQFCDTDFLASTKYTLEELVQEIELAGGETRFVVFTGGEPLLQLDQPLLDALHLLGWYIAVETNGTQPLPGHIDWVCVSPKAFTTLAITTGDELKLVYPQVEAEPEQFEGWAFDHFWLSPMDSHLLKHNTDMAVAYVLKHPQWRLNIQMHKQIGVK